MMTPQETFLGLVRAALPDWPVFDGAQQLAAADQDPSLALPDRYVVVSTDSGLVSRPDVGRSGDGETCGFQVMCVTSGTATRSTLVAAQARWAARRVRDQLTRTRLTPAGGLIEHTVSNQVARDEQMVSRLRPIFLTSAVAAMGVLPMIISQSPMWAGMASIMFFGTLITMVLIVTVLPILYYLLYRKHDKISVKNEDTNSI